MATDIDNKSLNQFRAADAFEFVDAVHRARSLPVERIEALMRRLIERTGLNDTLHLAAYRGYEFVLCTKSGGRMYEIVKLNDTL